jgi:hypothetical protein
MRQSQYQSGPRFPAERAAESCGPTLSSLTICRSYPAGDAHHLPSGLPVSAHVTSALPQGWIDGDVDRFLAGTACQKIP